MFFMFKKNAFFHNQTIGPTKIQGLGSHLSTSVISFRQIVIKHSQEYCKFLTFIIQKEKVNIIQVYIFRTHDYEMRKSRHIVTTGKINRKNTKKILDS